MAGVDISVYDATTDVSGLVVSQPHVILMARPGTLRVARVYQIENGITHTAADQKRLKAGLVQPVQDFQGTRGNLVPRDIVGRARNDFGFNGVSLLFSKYIYCLGNEFAGV